MKKEKLQMKACEILVMHFDFTQCEASIINRCYTTNILDIMGFYSKKKSSELNLLNRLTLWSLRIK